MVGGEGARGIEHEAHDENEQKTRDEVAILQQVIVEKGSVCGRQSRVCDEVCARHDEADHLDPGLGGGEPIILLAAIEQQLQRADRHAQGGEPEHVEALGARPRHRTDVPPHAVAGQQADGHVDEEHPSPAITVGQPASQRRTQYRSHHDPHAPDGHGGALLFLGIDIHEDDLGQRHQGRAEHTLQQARGDDLRQRIGHSTQHGGSGEAGDGCQKYIFLPEAIDHPPGERGRDRRRHDVGGQYPGDLILGGRQRSLHVR
jgi:hypothetical protein